MGNLCCLVHVDQSTVAITESFGNFDEVLNPGYHCVPWFCGKRVAGTLTLRILQLQVECKTKTKDNVSVNVEALVKFRALADKASNAFYKFSNTNSLIQTCFSDVIRATVPKLNLDAAFKQKNEIAKAVEAELEKAISAYGFKIVGTLIVDIKPDVHVKKAMNETNAAARPKLPTTATVPTMTTTSATMVPTPPIPTSLQNTITILPPPNAPVVTITIAVNHYHHHTTISQHRNY